MEKGEYPLNEGVKINLEKNVESKSSCYNPFYKRLEIRIEMMLREAGICPYGNHVEKKQCYKCLYCVYD